MDKIHQHYDQLSRKERQAVDDAFAAVFKVFNAAGVPLSGADPAERAVDALAQSVIESRNVPRGTAGIPRKHRVVITRSSVEAALAPASVTRYIASDAED